MPYKIDACSQLDCRSTLIAQDKGWLAQYEDHVIAWDIGSVCWWPGLPVGQHYKVAMNARYILKCYQDVEQQQKKAFIEEPQWYPKYASNACAQCDETV